MDDLARGSCALARHEIAELFARYAWSHDSRDIGSYLDCFTTGAVFTVLTGGEDGNEVVLRGHEQLEAFQTPRWLARAAEQRHVITNFRFASISDREAVVSSYLVLLKTSPGEPPNVGVTGAYDAVVTWDSNSWRIAELTLTED
jgi:3-phenylpropionate/cinnamic acid dioxygenase small subunit